MKYPQAYLVIHKDFVMPPLATLKAWAQPCQDFYVPSFLDSNEKLNEKISAILEIHTNFTEKWSKDEADSSTRCNKDEPGNRWLRMSRHHGHSNRQVQVARCTSTSAEK
ncbi:hypothetical protein, partial [Limnohabitans sp. Jir72]|uniref:hypothetical protein n=1 Tax=Limnohabitans sp. Jir72 TaxID=1977909 RepID=UPI001304C476